MFYQPWVRLRLVEPGEPLRPTRCPKLVLHYHQLLVGFVVRILAHDTGDGKPSGFIAEPFANRPLAPHHRKPLQGRATRGLDSARR